MPATKSHGPVGLVVGCGFILAPIIICARSGGNWAVVLVYLVPILIGTEIVRDELRFRKQGVWAWGKNSRPTFKPADDGDSSALQSGNEVSLNRRLRATEWPLPLRKR